MHVCSSPGMQLGPELGARFRPFASRAPLLELELGLELGRKHTHGLGRLTPSAPASRMANASLDQRRNRTKPVEWVQLEPPARAPGLRAGGRFRGKKKNFVASWTSGSAGNPGLFS